MPSPALIRMLSWFRGFTAGYALEEPAGQAAMDLKRDHTLRVMGEISVLGKRLGLDPWGMETARIAAICHDLGRFEQFARHKTFADPASEDHAALSAAILDERHVLDWLDARTRDIVRHAVFWHNKRTIPTDGPELHSLFLRLLRDADKLDIWRVVTRHYKQRRGVPNETIEMNLPDGQDISQPVLQDILAGRVVDSANIKSLSDFKALQMGWVLDLNFPTSFALLDKRGYLEEIARTLPASPAARCIYTTLRSHLDRRLADPAPPPQ